MLDTEIGPGSRIEVMLDGELHTLTVEMIGLQWFNPVIVGRDEHDVQHIIPSGVMLREAE